MSNITLFGSADVPAHVRNAELSATAKALVGSANNTKRISIKGGVFRLMSGGKEMTSIDDRFLDVVIVAAAPKVSRIFYAAAYDAENPAPPDCWSNAGDVPDPTAKDKQSDTCMKCEQNIAGSGIGNSRACRYQQRLAVVTADNVGGDVLQLTLPALSIFGKEDGDKRPLQAYARYLAMQNPPVNPEAVVTQMRFDTKAESPKLFFKPVRWLTDDEFAIVKAQAETADAQQATTMTVAAMDGVKAAPLALTGKAPAAAKVEEPEEDEAPAPVKTRKPRATKPAEEEAEPEVRKPEAKATAVPDKPKGSLASIVADWDDE